MFAKLNRFHGYGSLRAVYGKGQTVRGGQLSLRYSSRPSSKPFRVAVVVSRKVSKSAVVRNRIRRRVYEAVRTSQIQLLPGTDLVFTAFSEQLAELPASQLQKLVDGLLQKTTV
jgi:ribonuclease P protein component